VTELTRAQIIADLVLRSWEPMSGVKYNDPTRETLLVRRSDEGVMRYVGAGRYSRTAPTVGPNAWF